MSIHDKFLDGRDKVQMAVDRIRFHCAGKRVLVAFSGGKDSQCCYHLCKEAGIEFSAQYSITRFEPPELIPFIRANYPDVTFRRNYKRSLVDEIGTRGLPNRWCRWCCGSKHQTTPGFDIAVIGVRAGESWRRAKNWRSFGKKPRGNFYVCPVFEWSEDEVWEYLNERGIPHCCLYDQGFSRIGCVCCPLAPKNMRRDAARWPKTAEMLYQGHLKHWNRAIEKGGVTRNGTPFRMLEWGDPRRCFENWLDTGMTTVDPNAKQTPPDAECLFAGTGYSESDADTEDGE